MKKTLSVVFTMLLLLAVTSGIKAQKVAIVKGKLDFLKGQKTLKIEFDFDKFRVGSKTESEYIKESVAKKNKDKKGSGDQWLESWNNDKTERYPTKFESLVNETLAKRDIIANRTEDGSTYTMIVKTTRIEPGYNVGISRRNAELDVEIIFVETANHDNILAKLTVLNSQGMLYGGTDFDTGTRISEAYAKCGKSLGGFLSKKIPK